jgi:hypothetical protein
MKEKKTLLQEAILEYDEIVKNAEAIALKKTAEEFPEKFNSLLKEELNKKNKKSEEIKDDENENTESLDDTNEKNNSKKMKNEKKKISENMGFSPDADYLNNKEAEQGDDYLTIDEIENEINMMEELSNDVPDDDSFDYDNLDLSELDNFEDTPEGGNSEFSLDDDFGDYDELEKDFDSQFGDEEPMPSDTESFGNDEPMPTNDDPTSDDGFNLDDLEGLDFDDDIEEGLGITHARRKGVDAGLNPDHYPERRRLTYHEGEKKMGRLIEQNKKTTKKMNEYKGENTKLTKLVEDYKSVLSKYRNQLKEMAVFNTNLAHVNNLLVNESLSLTKDDKVKIIKEFKEINTIEASETKYKNVLKEMSQHKKKTIDESLARKVSNTINPSSKQKLDEVVEKNVYANDAHINKIKKLINYVERKK